MFLWEIFRMQTKIIDGWPNPSHKKLTCPDPGMQNKIKIAISQIIYYL